MEFPGCGCSLPTFDRYAKIPPRYAYEAGFCGPLLFHLKG